MVEVMFSSDHGTQVVRPLRQLEPPPAAPESTGGVSPKSLSTHAAIQEEEPMTAASVTSEPCFVFASDVLVEKPLWDDECHDRRDGSSADVHNAHADRQDKHPVTRGPSSDDQSRTNLFIGNLPHKMEQRDLVKLFAPYGQILSAAVMRNIHTGDSLGTAFVRYATTEEAMSAIEGMSKKRVNGRVIVVQWAKKQHDDAPVGDARKKICKLFVRNIPLDINIAVLERMFSRYGPVKSVSIHKDTAPDTERNSKRHIAFITYSVDGAAEQAAEAVHNTRPFPSCGKVPLMVKLAEDHPQHSHHGTGGGNVNNALKAKKHAQRGTGAMSSGQEHVIDATPVQQCFPMGTGASAMAVAPTSFVPVMTSGGLILPASLPRAVVGGEPPPYPWGPTIAWPRDTGVPLPFCNAGAAATAAKPAALNSALAAASGSPAPCMNNGGFTSFPVYTTPFCPSMTTGFSGARADHVGGSPIVGVARLSSVKAGHAAGSPEGAAMMTVPPQTDAGPTEPLSKERVLLPLGRSEDISLLDSRVASAAVAPQTFGGWGFQQGRPAWGCGEQTGGREQGGVVWH